jgi:protein gp37
MSKTNIEWTSATWNPTTGCTKISKECENCYAEKLTKRYMTMPNHVKYHKGFDKFVMHEDALNEPFKWKEPKTVFVNSMSDLFHKEVKIEFLKKVFAVMNKTPQHTYQILTKRANYLKKYSDQLTWSDNIWMGVSVGHKAGERRIQDLVDSGAKHKFLSVEPLIEELNDLNLEGIDWVIVGGESGDNKSRP